MLNISKYPSKKQQKILNYTHRVLVAPPPPLNSSNFNNLRHFKFLRIFKFLRELGAFSFLSVSLFRGFLLRADSTFILDISFHLNDHHHPLDTSMFSSVTSHCHSYGSLLFLRKDRPSCGSSSSFLRKIVLPAKAGIHLCRNENGVFNMSTGKNDEMKTWVVLQNFKGHFSEVRYSI